ncbi:MAG TPA: hypothetical protein VGY54_20830, partial [Polyangiaceae bacterium]|nr:hypothetical protein [Polyangiaceae bacterium]
LAEATIACLGAIGPFDYTTDALGLLAPTFDKCPAELQPPTGATAPALVRIKRLLSLQQDSRRQFAPFSVACIRDAYLVTAKTLIGSGITVCPNWHKIFAGGVPSARNAAVIARRMPRPRVRSANDPVPILVIDPPKIGSGFRFPKEYFFYTVSFDNVAPPATQTCGSPLECARACAGLFEGFFVGRFGRYIVGDPYWWLDPTDYGGFDAAHDPYNRLNGYYHPMSLVGDLPGEIYGDFARAAFADPSNPDPSKSAELCTMWDGTDHVIARLIQDQLLPDPSTWLSRCELYPPGVPVF